MLRKSTLATLVYYDILGYPLTEFEVWKHLIQPTESGSKTAPPSLAEVTGAIDALVAERRLGRFRGFVLLPGRENIVLSRIHDEKRAVQKIKRAARLIHLLSWVPYVRMIGLTGSLSMKLGDAGSDWDFFVVLHRGAIWRGRFFLSLVLQLMGKRRHGRYVENRACLNHFVTDGSLEITMQDFFSAHEYRYIYPVFGWDTFRRFELVNRWMTQIKPTFTLSEIPSLWLDEPKPAMRRLQAMLEKFLERQQLERWLASWQKKKIMTNPKTQIEGAFIVANDEALIFLPHPKGPAIFERFKQALSLT
ncbi:MAG: hypothetical protein ACEQSB_02730 [Undibacterium sp.]